MGVPVGTLRDQPARIRIQNRNRKRCEDILQKYMQKHKRPEEEAEASEKGHRPARHIPCMQAERRTAEDAKVQNQAAYVADLKANMPLLMIAADGWATPWPASG